MSEPLEKKVTYSVDGLWQSGNWVPAWFDYDNLDDVLNRLRELRTSNPKSTFRLRKKTDEVLNL